jgi:hypothetical protein
MSLVISLNKGGIYNKDYLIYALVSITIISLSIITKKIIGNYLDIEVESKIFPFQRWWFTKWSYFKKPIPAGIIFPTILLLITSAKAQMLTFLSFYSTALPSKVAKRIGRHRYSEVTEWDESLIAFWSLAFLWIIAIISNYLLLKTNIYFFYLLKNYTLYYSIWNMIPWGHLDGSRIFYGSKNLYFFALILLLALSFLIL